MTTVSNGTDDRTSVRQRRADFITHLHGLHRGLSSDNRYNAGEARRVMAQLRRCFSSPRYEAEAYDTLFDFDPPEAEQHVWLLIAGLFALNPQPWPGNAHRRSSVGTAMGRLAQERGDSVRRRFTQLIAVESPAIPYYLRQAVQLLSTAAVPLDYYRLLDELADLLTEDPHGYKADRRQRIRLTWARDYHRAVNGAPVPEESDRPDDRGAPGAVTTTA